MPTAAPLRDPAGRARLSDADALAMYHDLSIHELGKLAFGRLMELHPEPYRTYVVDRNINYSNVCTAKCIFCNFYTKPGKPDAYILSYDEIGRKIEELIDIGGTQILMQGGLVPDASHPSGHGLPFEWYLDLLRFIRKNYPGIHIHAFSPPEIWAFHQVFKMPLRDVLLRLRDAGLATIPGGGGEILVDRVRDIIGQGKTITHEWLAVMREAHKLGMKTSCTMMFGHIETIEERIEHMRLLRDLQDELGGFTAFIHWPFQPEGTPLGRWPVQSSEFRVASAKTEASPGAGSELATRSSLLDTAARGPRPDGKHLLLADAHEYLVMLAIARLYLDNIPNIQSSWVTMGPKVGQLALFYGANDMGSVMMEENVVSQAGATFRLSEDEIRRLITDAGWQPQQRDQYYRPITTPRRKKLDAPAVAISNGNDAAKGLVRLTVGERR
ncbi:Aminodeoxyfutalosine synthase [Phycisphaerae bacterium RAS1]|nr:Aminodeoxyfutalosine synthase [Phycisphaerae bacterium RAS1]